MSCQPRVKDLTTGRTVKRSQANGWIEQCAYVWIEKGISIRRLTVAEMRDARAVRAKQAEPLPSANPSSLDHRRLIWEPPPNANSQSRRLENYQKIAYAGIVAAEYAQVSVASESR